MTKYFEDNMESMQERKDAMEPIRIVDAAAGFLAHTRMRDTAKGETVLLKGGRA